MGHSHATPIHTRQPLRPEVPDLEQESQKYIATALSGLREQFADLAKIIEDRSHPVDEYQPKTLATDAETTITVGPTYEYMNEQITSVIVSGPAAATVTLQLGDRIWPLVIPASGILVIAPIAIILDRHDQRILTASVAGEYSIELTGFADRRFSI